MLTNLPVVRHSRSNPTLQLQFETHKVEYQSDSVSLAYDLFYPLAAPNQASLRAFQQALLTDCFDPALAACDPLPNPASLIAARISWYQQTQLGDDAFHLPQRWRVATDEVHMNHRFVSWTVTATSCHGDDSPIPVTIARILDCDGGWMVPSAHLWEPSSIDRLRLLILDHLAADISGAGFKVNRTAASRIPISNAVVDYRGITFVYNPGELAGLELGGMRAQIPWREIEPLLTSRYRAIATRSWTTHRSSASQSYYPN